MTGSVAQWLEQGIHKPKVVGSNPTRANFNIFSKINFLLFLNIDKLKVFI